MLVLTAVLWSSSGLLIKIINWSPIAVLGGRSLISMFVIGIYLRKINLRVTGLQLLGAVCYVLTQLLFISATKLTTAANAIFLQYASPIYIVILGYIFLKEKPHKADWIAMGVIFGGLLLFFGDQLSFDGVYGNVLSIISGVTISITMLIMRAEKKEDPAKIIFIGNIIGFLVGVPFIISQPFSPQALGIISYLGTFQIGLSFVFYSIAIRKVPALEANLLLTLEPILNPIWVFLVLGEQPGKMAVFGSILVVGAVIYRAIVSSRQIDLVSSQGR